MLGNDVKTLGLVVVAMGLGMAPAFAASKPPAQPAGIQLPQVRPSISDETNDPSAGPIKEVLRLGLKAGIFIGKNDADQIVAYYAAQDYVPTWTADGKLTDRAKALIARLAEADTDGLDPQAYVTPPLDLGQSSPVDADAAARADVMLSEALYRYAHDAEGGRVDPSLVSDGISYERHVPTATEALSAIAGAEDPVTALVAFNPPQEGFQRLRDKLAALKKSDQTRPPAIPVAGPMLKLGVTDPRVVLLRERLGVTAAAANPQVFDADVAAAVKEFQTAAKLHADGVAGKGTLAVMNRASQDHSETILVNMEKWRWMPRDLGAFYVKVNVPDFTVDVYQDGGAVYSTRIVVGKVTNQTPIFSDQMQFIIVNPTWNVPASIALKEMLPTLQQSGGSVRGFDFFAKVRGRFRPVDPRFINWYTVDMRNIQIKQPPGEKNALGAIKFMFPNKYAVYLHDTPSKALFQQSYRALSHGCMRVMDPMSFADVILAHEHNGWNSARLQKLIGGPEQRVDLPVHIPVHITYFTAWVDEDGNLQTRDDLYGHDSRISAALAGHPIAPAIASAALGP